MANVVVLQRLVPSYRMPVYRRLADELGWKVVFGQNLGRDNLKVMQDAPFLHGVDFINWSRKGSTRYRVPVSEILTKFKPDAIVAEGALGLTSTWELGARRMLGGTKLLFWSIGYDPDSARPNPSQWPYIMAYAPADALIVYGKDGADFLRRYYAKKPIFVAQNTIDVEELWHHRDSAIPAPRSGRPELVSLGRMNANKDFVTLVKAFLEFRKKFPDAVLKIIGDGPDRAKIEAAAGDQLGKSVRLLGASFDEPETARHLLSADLFVMAGRIGLAINHALAYDLPVMMFTRGPDGPFHGSEALYLVDGTTGFLVRDVGAMALARKLEEVFADGRDCKSELRPSIRSFVDKNLIVDRMLDGFRAADAFVEAQAARH
jgi:glycosyltransferase involved in cell wall biosynthesis